MKKPEHQRIDVFELWCWRRLLRVPWTARRSNKSIPKEIIPKGNHFIGRTDAEAEAPILWLPDAKSWLIGKDPDAGKDWRQKEKRTVEGWLDRFTVSTVSPSICHEVMGPDAVILVFWMLSLTPAFSLMKMWWSILSFSGTQSKERNRLHHVWIPYKPHSQPASQLLCQHFAFNWCIF